MNNENTRKLLEKYPCLYGISNTVNPWSDKLDKPFLPIEGFGIECGDGWFDLLDDLSNKIEGLKLGIQATQVKEKYGTLRFYTNFYNEQVEEYIQEAERKSEYTCEVCGKPGALIAEGWWKVRCPNCE
jgi:hypothetical protein